MPKTLIIAATSARGYAQAAVACGYQVITIDAFADADTRNIAKQAFKVRMAEDVVDLAEFKRIFSTLDFTNCVGFLYGSLFDNAQELLTWVAERVTLLGNVPEVMQTAKSYAFFTLLDELGIQHPENSLTLPANPADWLSKKLGGSGGMHIRAAELTNFSDYFQRKVDGRSISMLFIADGKTVHLIGFNAQFVSPSNDLPYRFAGAVGCIQLPDDVHAQLMCIAQQLTIALGLRGINSLDAILQLEQQTLWILELNPRLSATFYLYPNLLSAHMQACSGDLNDFQQQLHYSRAQQILYADNDLQIPSNFAWPNWVTDIPAIKASESNVIIERNAPICTVMTEAENAETAQMLISQRAKILREMLLK